MYPFFAQKDDTMNRRDFLKDSIAASATLTMAGGIETAHAQEKPKTPDKAPDRKTDDSDPIEGPPIRCAVIGLGPQGREIMASLAKIKGGKGVIAAVCDTYNKPVFTKKTTAIAPDAKFYDDYRRVLDDKTIQAVFIATPSHKHKEITLNAIAAGKHVYCEAPIANDLDEAKAIALAGLNSKNIFMPGLQVRSNKQHHHVMKFVRSGALGKLVYGRAQHHERTSWRQASGDETRMRELNWRLSKDTSMGLVGEIGIHQIDAATWFTKSLPVSVTGTSSLLYYKDGRDVPDTVSCVVEYPNQVLFNYDATIVNSFEGAYETFFGSSCAIMLRDQRAWMYKENDSDLLGWEVFARKDDYDLGKPELGSGVKIGSGIALVADATKQIKLGRQPGEVGTDISHTALFQAVWEFLNGINKDKKPDVGPLEGYHATVIAHKVNEAVLTGTKIAFDPKWFELS